MIGESYSPISASKNSIKTGFDFESWLFCRYFEPVYVVTSRVMLPDKMACFSVQVAVAGKLYIFSIRSCKCCSWLPLPLVPPSVAVFEMAVVCVFCEPLRPL